MSTSSTTIITINDKGIIQSVDKNCCSMFGFTMDELIGHPIKIIIPPPYKEQHDTYLENYHKTKQRKVIGLTRYVEGQHKDGTVFRIKLSVSEIPIPNSPIYVGIIDKLENTSATITANIKGTIVNCNENCKNIWGYEVEEMKGMNLSKLMPNPYSDNHDQFINNYIETGKRHVIGKVRNVPALHKDGTIIPISLQVQQVQVIDGVTLFHGKIDLVSEENELVFTLNSSGYILSCNKLFVVPLLGFTAEELCGKHIRVILPALQYNSNNEALISRIGKKRSSGYSMPSSATKIKRTNADGSSGSLGVDSSIYLSEDEFTPTTIDLESWLGKHETNCKHSDDSFFKVYIHVTKFVSDNKSCFAVKVKRVIDTPSKSINEFYPSNDHNPTNLVSSLGDGKYSLTNKSIGSGSFGRVYLGHNPETKQEVAIKLLQKDSMNKMELERAMREVNILTRLRHPNICALYDWYETENTLFLVMEYVKGGELFSYIHKQGKLKEQEARYFFKQISEAVEFCHSNNIIHRDIKDKNILLDEHSNVKLIDFGLSNFTDGSLQNRTFCGTPAYSAPEMVLGAKYKGPEVDVWSLGVVLYFMVAGEAPFATISDITQGVFQPPFSVSHDCKEIIKRMLVVSISERATMKELLSHPFVTGEESLDVEPNLTPSQVPNFTAVPLDLITIEKYSDDP